MLCRSLLLLLRFLLLRHILFDRWYLLQFLYQLQVRLRFPHLYQQLLLQWQVTQETLKQLTRIPTEMTIAVRSDLVLRHQTRRKSLSLEAIHATHKRSKRKRESEKMAPSKMRIPTTKRRKGNSLAETLQRRLVLQRPTGWGKTPMTLLSVLLTIRYRTHLMMSWWKAKETRWKTFQKNTCHIWLLVLSRIPALLSNTDCTTVDKTVIK